MEPNWSGSTRCPGWSRNWNCSTPFGQSPPIRCRPSTAVTLRARPVPGVGGLPFGAQTPVPLWRPGHPQPARRPARPAAPPMAACAKSRPSASWRCDEPARPAIALRPAPGGRGLPDAVGVDHSRIWNRSRRRRSRWWERA